MKTILFITDLHTGSRVPELAGVREFAESVMRRRQQVYDESEGVSRQELDRAISQAAEASAQMAAAEQAYEEAVAGPRVEEIAQAEARLESLRQKIKPRK